MFCWMPEKNGASGDEASVGLLAELAEGQHTGLAIGRRSFLRLIAVPASGGLVVPKSAVNGGKNNCV